MMDIERFDWMLLRSFLAVVDTGSLAGAARKLGSYQPTLSRQIGELERQLGVPLFERTGRGLATTRLGQRLEPIARAMAASAGEIASAITRDTDDLSGVVRVSCSQVFASWILPPLLVSARRKFPSVQLELVATNQMSSLHRREADIAVRLIRPTQATLRTRKVGELKFGAYAATTYLRRRKAPQGVSDLTQHELVGLDRDETLIRACQDAGLDITRESFALRTDDQVALIELVRQGAGIGFMPICVGQEKRGLRQVLAGSALPEMSVWLVVHREISGNPAIRAIFDHLAEELPGILRPKEAS